MIWGKGSNLQEGKVQMVIQNEQIFSFFSHSKKILMEIPLKQKDIGMLGFLRGEILKSNLLSISFMEQ